MDKEEKKEVNSKENLEIEKQIEEINREVDGQLSEVDKENLRKILKLMGSKPVNNKWIRIIRHIKSVIFSLMLYLLVYFALFGVLNGVIKYSEGYQIAILVASISIYQAVFKYLLSNTFKSVKKYYAGVTCFLITSLFIITQMIELTKVITFENFGYILVFYLGGEFLVFLIKYYISKYIIEEIFR